MFTYGIPTYKRTDNQKTLDYLTRLGVPKERIILSTQTQTEYEVCNALYSDRAMVIFGEAVNVAGNRNTILAHAPQGEWVLFLDDDVSSVCSFRNNKVYRIPDERVERVIEGCIGFAERVRSLIFGVYPIDNAMFGSGNGVYTLKSIVIGTMMGVKNVGLRFDTSFPVKEDYELCAQVLSKGMPCVRFNNITVRASHYSQGGCCDLWKGNANSDASRHLVAKYPSLFALKRGGARAVRSKTIEVKLIDKI